MASTPSATKNLAALAAETFIYAYPLEYCLREIDGFANGHSTLPIDGPWNQFAHAKNLLGPETTFVSPNNDTLYSIAALDLRDGPLLLEVPAMGSRYYVLQFADAWSNNFAYVGTRATGNGAGSYVLHGPDQDPASLPSGATAIGVPTGIAIVIGRIQVDGEADLDAVHTLQERFSLAPVGDEAVSYKGLPATDPGVSEDLAWWERVRVQLASFPPPAADAPFLDAAHELGLIGGDSPLVDPSEELRAALVDGQAKGRAMVEQLGKGGKPGPTGWRSAMHFFDYNLDSLGLGTIDSPEWKIADRKVAYATRAAAARGGLFGNHGYEADYELISTDAEDDQLNGAHSYRLRLEETPPVDAFWSLTMYSVPEYLLVANPIDRYSIGDRTPGLEIAEDGSLTILMQTDSPGPDRESNWLPTPTGDFRPIMRMYGPRESVLDGGYALPAIEKV
ncbi:MAG TPA: DUF1254 domain-containing protein [Solirubrobacterales bacterium]|nr:DUF1254 domain-containing protein [Solirubrobacterales bacterium]